MFEEIIEFIGPVLHVFTAVVIVSLGIALCAGCIMLAIKVCGHFNALVKEKSVNVMNRWAKRTDNLVVRIGERIGHFVGEAVRKSQSSVPEDLRPRMVGEWISDRGDFMTISEHGGYYKVKFRGCDMPESIPRQEFLLRDIQGWLHDDNVYCAESLDLLTLGVNDEVEEIFVSELKRTYLRFKADNTLSPKMELSDIQPVELEPELLRKLVEVMPPEVEDNVNRNIMQ